MEIVLTGQGGPEMLRIDDTDSPAPGKGEVRVRVEASGVSFAEVQMLAHRVPDAAEVPVRAGLRPGRHRRVGRGRGDRGVRRRPGGGADGDRRVAHARRRAGADRVVPVPERHWTRAWPRRRR